MENELPGTIGRRHLVQLHRRLQVPLRGQKTKSLRRREAREAAEASVRVLGTMATGSQFRRSSPSVLSEASKRRQHICRLTTLMWKVRVALESCFSVVCCGVSWVLMGNFSSHLKSFVDAVIQEWNPVGVYPYPLVRHSLGTNLEGLFLLSLLLTWKYRAGHRAGLLSAIVLMPSVSPPPQPLFLDAFKVMHGSVEGGLQHQLQRLCFERYSIWKGICMYYVFCIMYKLMGRSVDRNLFPWYMQGGCGRDLGAAS